MQRFKAVELAGEAGWAVASRMELIAPPSVSAAPLKEREAALTLGGRARNLQGLAEWLRKCRPWGTGRGDSAERPAVTLRPSPKARAALLAAAPEGAAGKKRKRRGRARRFTAERRLKLAREASAAEPPTDQARARSASPTFLVGRSPIRGSSRSQRSTSASSGTSRSSEPESRWATQGNQLADLSDAEHYGLAPP